jgi:hypothetical protein
VSANLKVKKEGWPLLWIYWSEADDHWHFSHREKDLGNGNLKHILEITGQEHAITE